jgi:hypothetical protein
VIVAGDGYAYLAYSEVDGYWYDPTGSARVKVLKIASSGAFERITAFEYSGQYWNSSAYFPHSTEGGLISNGDDSLGFMGMAPTRSERGIPFG